MQDVSVTYPLQDDDGGQDARAREEHGPWRCLPGCVAHRDGSTGNDSNGECCATLDVGATGLSTSHHGGLPVELAVELDRFAERGVSVPASVVIEVHPQGACQDGLFVLTPHEVRHHIAQLQAALTAAEGDPYEPVRPSTDGPGDGAVDGAGESR